MLQWVLLILVQAFLDDTIIIILCRIKERLPMIFVLDMMQLRFDIVGCTISQCRLDKMFCKGLKLLYYLAFYIKVFNVSG